MGLTTMTNAKIPDSHMQPLPGEHSCREALQQALVELHQLENYEHAREEEWFEVDDPEMYAYPSRVRAGSRAKSLDPGSRAQSCRGRRSSEEIRAQD
jgi:hypothetical protein